jgi:hypothetical protein
MIRIVRLSQQYYGYDMGDIQNMDMEDFMETHIEGFVNSGDPVLLVHDLSDVKYMIPGIDEDDIQMVGEEGE